MSIPWRARRNVDAYLDWVGETIEQSGGHLDADCQGTDYLFTRDLEDDGEVIGVNIRENCLRFYDGTHMHIRQLVSLDVDVFEYSYQYMHNDGSLIGRLCKNPHYEPEVGGLTHAHLPGNGQERILPSQEFDFDDAVTILRRMAEGFLDLTNFPG